MANPLTVRAYYAVLSASFAAKTDLSTLLKAAYLAISATQVIPDLTGVEINIYSIAANSKTILVGDAGLTTTNYGYVILSGGSRKYGPFRMSAIPLSNIFVMSDDGTTGVQIGIEVVPG